MVLHGVHMFTWNSITRPNQKSSNDRRKEKKIYNKINKYIQNLHLMFFIVPFERKEEKKEIADALNRLLFILRQRFNYRILLFFSSMPSLVYSKTKNGT